MIQARSGEAGQTASLNFLRELIKIKISKIPIDGEDVLVVDKLGKKQKHILKVLELEEPTPLQM